MNVVAKYKLVDSTVDDELDEQQRQENHMVDYAKKVLIFIYQ
jgi:hypothetical protein